MSVGYYVWYRVADADDRELEQAVRGMQARLACRTGVAGRLLKRRDAPATWMEVYEAVAEPAAFERVLQALVDQFDIEVRLADRRHVECFVESPGAAVPACAVKEI
ncbi:uncharacterized protein DUF4936 [Sulfuritortus calidifontis]|uniref:Uncharacterized protein DUF4936 n=1 Tax=Sulfuritortus calidifontis TaxID=1914471 RepID=A0A4R3JY69_9PROT|nr:DUF4936 family protein [Sulfuritortus calidifontis]TCS72227.1 uncharacterized protein DUF4936 [Sulfuritortus calidifontis]